MRSSVGHSFNPIRDTTRPPPPVPPRPSKQVVAEALAKSRASINAQTHTQTVEFVPSINSTTKLSVATTNFKPAVPKRTIPSGVPLPKPRPRQLPPTTRTSIQTSKSTEDLTANNAPNNKTHQKSRTLVYRSPSLRNSKENLSKIKEQNLKNQSHENGTSEDEHHYETINHNVTLSNVNINITNPDSHKEESIYGKIRPLQEKKLYKSMDDITKDVSETYNTSVIYPKQNNSASESDSDYFSSLGNMDSSNCSTHTVLIIDNSSNNNGQVQLKNHNNNMTDDETNELNVNNNNLINLNKTNDKITKRQRKPSNDRRESFETYSNGSSDTENNKNNKISS